jgi:hypothetical protein
MFAGKGEVSGTVMGFLFWGFSSQHFWFRSDTRGVKKKIISSSDESPAHMCERCGAVALPPPRSFSEKLNGAARRVTHYIESRPNKAVDPTPEDAPRNPGGSSED